MSTASYPEDLRYHEAHDWARIDGDTATFGITWHAQDALGDIVFFEPAAVGDSIKAGGSYGELESVKAVSDLIAPLDGEVVAINDDVVNSPESVNDDPYSAWLIRIRMTAPNQVDGLLDAAGYQAPIS